MLDAGWDLSTPLPVIVAAIALVWWAVVRLLEYRDERKRGR